MFKKTSCIPILEPVTTLEACNMMYNKDKEANETKEATEAK